MAGGKVKELGDELPPGVRATPDTWQVHADYIGGLLDKLFEQTALMVDHGRRAAGLKRLIDKRGDGRVGRQSTVMDCLACDTSVSGVGEDRIKAGYGPCCYKKWMRFCVSERAAGRDPNHEVFRRRVRRERERAS